MCVNIVLLSLLSGLYLLCCLIHYVFLPPVKFEEVDKFTCVYILVWNKTGNALVILRRVRANVVAAEKQSVLHIVSVSVWPYVSSMQCACAILSIAA